MNEQNQRDSIMSMARGAFEERVDYEMDKVIQNILDPNTKATAKRKITLTIELTPDDERRTIGVSVTAKSTLAATNPVATALYVTSDGNGELVVAEMVPQVPGQMNMAVEEMAELTKALCKIKRAQAGCEVTAAIGNVIEEMADVQIMLDQLRIIFHRSTEEVEEAKLERLKNRLDGRNNWRDSSLHKWIENQFSAGGDGHE